MIKSAFYISFVQISIHRNFNSKIGNKSVFNFIKTFPKSTGKNLFSYKNYIYSVLIIQDIYKKKLVMDKLLVNLMS
jgi:hypothetical protein